MSPQARRRLNSHRHPDRGTLSPKEGELSLERRSRPQAAAAAPERDKPGQTQGSFGGGSRRGRTGVTGSRAHAETQERRPGSLGPALGRGSVLSSRLLDEQLLITDSSGSQPCRQLSLASPTPGSHFWSHLSKFPSYGHPLFLEKVSFQRRGRLWQRHAPGRGHRHLTETLRAHLSGCTVLSVRVQRNKKKAM